MKNDHPLGETRDDDNAEPGNVQHVRDRFALEVPAYADPEFPFGTKHALRETRKINRED